MSPFSFLSVLFSFVFFHSLCFAYFLFAFFIVSFCFTLFFIRSLINYNSVVLLSCLSRMFVHQEQTNRCIFPPSAAKFLVLYLLLWLSIQSWMGNSFFYSSVRWFISQLRVQFLSILFWTLFFWTNKSMPPLLFFGAPLSYLPGEGKY